MGASLLLGHGGDFGHGHAGSSASSGGASSQALPLLPLLAHSLKDYTDNSARLAVSQTLDNQPARQSVNYIVHTFAHTRTQHEHPPTTT